MACRCSRICSRDAAVTGLNQVWVADITYIRLPTEFVFLAAILDAHSRKVIGWNLSRRLDVSLTLTALECALAKRQIAPGRDPPLGPGRAVRGWRLRGEGP